MILKEERQVFGLADKKLTSLNQELLGLIPRWDPAASFLLMQALGGTSDCSRNWVPATCVGDLHGVPRHQIQPQAGVGFEGREPVDGRLFPVVSTVSACHINKKLMQTM